MSRRLLSSTLLILVSLSVFTPSVYAAMSVSTTKFSYTIGESVTMTVSGASATSFLLLQVNNPSGNPIDYWQTKVSTVGSYTNPRWNTTDSLSPGLYQIIVKDQVTKQLAVTSFYLTSPAPRYFLPPPASVDVEDLDPEDAATIMEDLNPADAADLLNDMDTESVADILEEMLADKVAEIVEEMLTDTLVDILETMVVDLVADIIGKMDIARAADVVEEVSTETAADVFEEMEVYEAANVVMAVPVERVVTVFGAMEVVAVAGIVEEVSVETVADIFEAMEVVAVAGIVEDVSVGHVADIFETMEVDTVVDVIEEVSVETVADVFDEMIVDAVVDIVEAMEVVAVAGIVEEVSVGHVADIFEEMQVVAVAGIVEEVSVGHVADIFEEMQVDTVAGIVEEVSVETVADVFETMEVEVAAAIVEEVSVGTASDIIIEMGDDSAVEVLAEVKLSSAVKIFETVDEKSETEAGILLDSAVATNKGDAFADVLLNVDEDTTATSLLKSKSTTGGTLVEKMTNKDLNSAAKRVEATIKIKARELDPEVQTQMLEKAARILEEVTVDSLVNLFITIVNLPNTPSTVAEVFEVMSLPKILDVVTAWIPTEDFESLNKVFSLLSVKRVTAIWMGMASTERNIILPHLPAAIAATVPELTDFTVSKLIISPSEVTVNELVSISVTVENAGIETGEYNIRIKINGLTEITEKISISADSSTTFTLNVAKDEGGIYTVESDGLTGTFKVTAPKPSPKPSPSPSPKPSPKPSPSPSPSPSPKPSPTPKPPVKPDNTVFYLLIAGILVGVAGYYYWKRTQDT